MENIYIVEYSHQVYDCASIPSIIDNNRYVYINKFRTVRIYEMLLENNTLHEIDTLQLNTPIDINNLCANIKNYTDFSLTFYEANNKQLDIEGYTFSSKIQIGEHSLCNHGISLGQKSTCTGHNQVVIGSHSSGVLDNSITLGNNETLNIIPRKANQCNIGHENYRIDTFIGNKIAFGNDHMQLPLSDGYENEILIRKGDKNISWGTIQELIAPFVETIQELQTRIEILEQRST